MGMSTKVDVSGNGFPDVFGRSLEVICRYELCTIGQSNYNLKWLAYCGARAYLGGRREDDVHSGSCESGRAYRAAHRTDEVIVDACPHDANVDYRGARRPRVRECNVAPRW